RRQDADHVTGVEAERGQSHGHLADPPAVLVPRDGAPLASLAEMHGGAVAHRLDLVVEPLRDRVARHRVVSLQIRGPDSAASWSQTASRSAMTGQAWERSTRARPALP